MAHKSDLLWNSLLAVEFFLRDNISLDIVPPMSYPSWVVRLAAGSLYTIMEYNGEIGMGLAGFFAYPYGDCKAGTL